MKKNLSFAFLLVLSLLSNGIACAQTTITTPPPTSSSSLGATNATITFAIQNTNAYPITLTDVQFYRTTTTSGWTYTLWYSTTNLSGPPGNVTTPTWNQIASTTASNVTTLAIHPLFTGLSFSIPGNTTWRFAMQASGGSMNYGGASNVPNTNTGGGVNLLTGSAQISGQNVGYSGSQTGPTFNPRFFIGSITFTAPPPVPNNAGIGAITEPPSNICVGNYAVKAQVKNNGSAVLNNVNVNWSVDGVLQTPVPYNTPIPTNGNATVTLGSVNFPMNVTRTIKVWSSDPNGVPDTYNVDDTVSTTRQATATAIATITPTGPTRFCPGDNVLLEANTGTGLSYQWQLNGNNMTGATNSTYTANASGVYTVQVQNSACALISQPVTVTVGPPDVDLGNDTSFCETKIPFELNADEANAKYLWSTGDSSQHLLITSQGGPYWVQVTLGQNCVASDTINLNIGPLPRVTGISYIKEEGHIYYFEPAGSQFVDKYLWIFSDNTTDTNMKVMHVFPVGQHHAVRLVISNACGKDSIEYQLPLSISSTAGTNGEVTIYPNPASNTLTIKMQKNAIHDIVIVNSIGATVRKEFFNKKNANEKIDISNLANGNYILLVNDGENIIPKTFQVVR